MTLKNDDILVPCDVPLGAKQAYYTHYMAVTRGKHRLALFSCDQKLEHLNRDFDGPHIDPADNDPAHMFAIAQQGDIGAFATHLGLIAHYGKDYPTINYIVKMNGKTDLVKTEQRDPLSMQLWTLEQVINFKKNSGLPIVGVGYTLYLGSEYESQMLAQAAQLIYEAHQHGLLTLLWMYPRGKSVAQERSGDIIAGAAGIALSLGADFAKINPPLATSDKTTEEWLAVAVQAAGRTKLIVSGGSKIDASLFLKELYSSLYHGKVSGNATGRNIHQRSLADAIALTRAISALVYEDKKPEEVMI